MLIGIVEANAKAELVSFIEGINSQQSAAWSVAVIRRSYFKKATNDEIVLAFKPALMETAKAKLYFLEEEAVYVTWRGMPRQTYQKICAAAKSLLRPEIKEMIEKIVAYFDPLAMGNELTLLLKTQSKAINGHGVFNGERKMPLAELAHSVLSEKNDFALAPAQLDQHRTVLQQKSGRQRLHLLIIEDQYFLRNLLSEVLRADYEIYTVPNLKEGWENYIKKAPDIVFLDIELPDGNGHTLAHKIKEIDPSSYVVMATASNQRDDVELAKYNHVDGFIVKPFSKKKILDCIDRYLAVRKTS